MDRSSFVHVTKGGGFVIGVSGITAGYGRQTP